MDRQTVDKSNIESIGYNSEGKILEVEFKNGNIYQYEGIGSEMFNSLMGAKSVGSFLHTNIIQGDYEATKVDEEGR